MSRGYLFKTTRFAELVGRTENDSGQSAASVRHGAVHDCPSDITAVMCEVPSSEAGLRPRTSSLQISGDVRSALFLQCGRTNAGTTATHRTAGRLRLYSAGSTTEIGGGFWHVLRQIALTTQRLSRAAAGSPGHSLTERPDERSAE